MNELKKILICVVLMISVIIPNLHVHNEQCGYDPTTGEGCIYAINPYYEYDPEED